MGKIRLAFVFFFFKITPLIAQVEIKGVVFSMSGDPIEGTSILIKDSQKNIVGYSFTQTKGNYSISISDIGFYTIEANFIGFVTKGYNLEVTSKASVLTQNFTLEESTEELKDLVIKVESPIKERGDTLVYDAKAFSTGREQVVEDLLKNIPGITIEKNGKIKYEDKEIEKVMIGGDDFFNKGYSLLTKNMPSKPLDKVEVLRKYSNNKLLKGIEESDKVALNLTIDDEYKDVWFGDLSLGYGVVSENRYNVSGNLMNFSKRYKNFFTFGMNNVGVDIVGSLNDMFYNGSDMESIDAYNAQPNQIMELSGGGTILKEHRTRFNNVEMVSLNTIVPLTQKIKAKFSGFMGFDELSTFRNSIDYTKINDTEFTNTENQNFKNKFKSGYLNAFLTYDISKYQMLQSSTLYSVGNTEGKSDLTFNEKSTVEELETKNTFFDQKLTYTHKWNEKNIMLLKGRFFSNRLPQFYKIDDYLMGDLFDFTAQRMNNDFKNDTQFFGLGSDLKFKQKNNDLIEVYLGYEWQDQNVRSKFYLFDNSQNVFQPEQFQSNFNYRLGNLYAKSGYVFNFKNVQLRFNADIHQLFNTFQSTTISIKQNPFYINPNTRFKWDINATNVLSLYYSLNLKNTDALEVNDSFLLSSSRSFNKGLSEFNLAQSQSVTLNYSVRHYLNRYRLSFGVNYARNNDMISTRSTIEQNSTLSENILIQGGNNFGAHITSNFYWKDLRSNLVFEVRGFQSESYNVVNDSDLRKNIFQNISYKWEWKSNFRIPFNFHLGTEWVNSKITSQFAYNYFSGFTFLDLFYRLGERIDIKATSEHYYFSNLEKGNRSYYFFDLNASYKLKGDKYTIGLTANNILNTKEFTTFYANDLGYSSTTYNLLPRYLLGTFKMRF